MIPSLAFFLTSIGLFIAAITQYSKYFGQSEELRIKRDRFLDKEIQTVLKGNPVQDLSQIRKELIIKFTDPSFRKILSNIHPTGFRIASISFGFAMVTSLLITGTQLMLDWQISLGWLLTAEVPLLGIGLFTYTDDLLFYNRLSRLVGHIEQ